MRVNKSQVKEKFMILDLKYFSNLEQFWQTKICHNLDMTEKFGLINNNLNISSW